MLSSFVTSYLMAQDIIVKKDGSILTVYNLEESNTSYFYSLEPSKDAPTQKIAKSEVFSVKKSDGTTQKPSSKNSNTSRKTSRKAVTATFSKRIRSKEYDNCFSAKTPDGKELNYAVLSESEKTLAVIKGEYHEKEYVIPEYVNVDGKIYTVTEIGNKGFYQENTILKIQFPQTLKKIGEKAFVYCALESIIFPEGLMEIGTKAFWGCSGHNPHRIKITKKNINEIFLPSSLKKIGEECFTFCGKATSYRGYCQAYFSNMPRFITESNCKTFGIDEEAVRAYQNSKK